MSAAIVSELFQSVGVEVSIFVITLALAAAFRGAPFGKTHGGSKKPTKTANSEGVQSRAAGVARSGSHDSKKSIKRSPSPVQASLPHGVSDKIESMIDFASRRQAVDAITLYDDLRANGEHIRINDCMRSGKHRPADAFSSMVHCAGRAGRPELIELFLEDMKQAGIERSLAFYESTMKMLASKKCYKEAMSVCSWLEADGLEPSPVTLSCLINFAVEIGESDRAIELFERLAANSMPSIRAYMTILRVYSRRPDWPKSLALIRDMQQRQAPIDSLVLNIVLATGVAAGKLDAAKALLKEFTQKEMADVVSYNTLMKGFAQRKEVDSAIQLIEEMCKAGVKPNAITFNTAMDAAVRSSRIADAWRVLARMRDAGLAPDKFTCTTLMKGLQAGATSEQLTVILDLLRNVTTAECDSTLGSFLFRNVIEAAVQINDPTLTARAVAQMREQRLMLPAQEYQRLLQALLREGEVKRCNTVHRHAPLEAMRPVRVC